MIRHIRKPKDFLAGLLFLVIGVGALLLLREFEFGVARRMGPGYFPSVLAGLLTLLALVLLIRSLGGAREAMGGIPLRAAALIVCGAFLFAVLIRPAGLVLALVPMTLIATSVISRSRIRGALLTTAVLVGGSILIFVHALGQPIPVLGYWFGK